MGRGTMYLYMKLRSRTHGVDCLSTELAESQIPIDLALWLNNFSNSAQSLNVVLELAQNTVLALFSTYFGGFYPFIELNIEL